MKRRTSGLRDFVRFVGEFIRLFATGYGQITKVTHWVPVALGAVGIGAFAWLANSLANRPISLTWKFGEMDLGTMNMPSGVFLASVAVAAWFVVALALAAYRFRPSPTLTILPVANGERQFTNRLHYKIILKNESRKSLTDCCLSVENTTPKVQNLPLRLRPFHEKEGSTVSKISLNDGESCTFELFESMKGLEWITWAGAGGRFQSPSQEYEIEVCAYGSGVQPARIKLRIRRAEDGSFQLSE